ncbi:hypothetical protein DOTSEDRAFT_24059 [Dothistroma septosporum NZE10]|uniref:SnoaL-like domain-containing protein n=1 Tax=Dothistroma septosporum (strain NZE10 / CBS 128990) TaxID=675120 RepID=N1PNF2_DOTSN|nr:hypothetical protein DOTSEDRAFT_24059 [Dothistroma septosporum NZE10]
MSTPSSLDLLNPRPWASRRRVPAGAIADTIDKWSQELIIAASNRDWTNPSLRRITPDFRAEFEHSNGIPINSWAEYRGIHEGIAADFPDYRFQTLDGVAEVDEKRGTGAVWLLLRVEGHPKDQVRESIIVFNWRCTDETWVCYKQKVVRGMLWDA